MQYFHCMLLRIICYDLNAAHDELFPAFRLLDKAILSLHRLLSRRSSS
jgi:hypothetical protein